MKWREFAWKEDPELGQLRATGSARTKMCVWYRSEDDRYDVVRGGGGSWSKAECYHLIHAETGEYLGTWRLQREAQAGAEKHSQDPRRWTQPAWP